MPKLAAIHDTEKVLPDGRVIRWAYATRTLALQKYAPAHWEVERICISDRDCWDRAAPADIVFNLDYTAALGARPQLRKRKSSAIYVTSFNRDALTRHDYWKMTRRGSDWVVCNNEMRYLKTADKSRLCCISNGLDLDLWHVKNPIDCREPLAIWTGGVGARKTKGYYEVLLPLQEKLKAAGINVECDFRPVHEIEPDQVRTQQDMSDWYNRAAIVVCASWSEGTPGYLHEAAACGCVPVTTWVGNVLEWGTDGENCVVCERDADSFVEGIRRALDRQAELATAAAEKMKQLGYGWPGNRAAYYFALFDRLLEKGTGGVKPFTYSQISPEEIGQ